MSSEQVLAAWCMVLVVVLSIAGMVIVTARPEAAVMTISFVGGTIAALVSLERRHDSASALPPVPPAAP